MTTTLTARGPEDLLAAVPVVLGFHPHDSLVLLTFDTPHCFHARVGLPPPGEAASSLPDLVADLVAALVTPCRRHDVGRVAVIGYSADARLVATVARALRTAFDRAGIGVITVVRAHDACWWPVPVDPEEPEPAPRRYDATAHPFAAQAVLEGRVTHASREHLRATLAAVPEAVSRVTALQAESRPSRAPVDGPGVVALVARCAATRQPLDDVDAARVLGAVVQAEVRDAVLYAVPREEAVSHLQVWADLLRRAPRAQVPDAAAVAAFCAWQAGDGALAWCALDRCFDVDPHHRLGLCLAECLTRAVPPGAWHDTQAGCSPGRAEHRQVRPPRRT